jgi:CrcB protein
MTSEKMKDRMIRNYVFVALGGGLGSALRYWVSGIVPRYAGSQFPFGILLVNIVGCFFIGLFMSSIEERFAISPTLRMFITVGILGGFTTFSTFSYETVAMLRDSEFLKAGAYVGASVFLGLGATHLGAVIGKIV